ncbi:hypothetical protein A3A05_02255 [Candidatus Nomurabacteria bacterium RIFCSPLOWO2_01_FULL_41_12]|uniref:Uncharacterized protein n=1 Tax=Candidatus Nomurabacteria bacterium RIFCSPLOWO2_01_FULL_41_12 TaxID=1801774 RepID=A0A1F6WUV6_9BACT|nr:MAG: hypothetical protein A2732_02175 [Candidatus Nomurabacteria bacterium RIFCSPHIGHO2_01_FULL_40_10]OGI85535.1 MAG: hypothetical protein A3A05_02255 [Candidatus Nomurabacteria bacterium RIFCSPLOWO2_01_FULL_41_12]
MRQNLEPKSIETQAPIDTQGDWAKDYPKSREEADALVKSARGAFHALKLPDTPGLADTPRLTLNNLFTIARHRAQLKDFDINNDGAGGIILPFKNTTKIPEGFEDWAKQKYLLALSLRDALHKEYIYTYRIAHERDESEDFSNRPRVGRFSHLSDEEIDFLNRESKETGDLIFGTFAIVIENGKPIFKSTSQEGAVNEVLDRLIEHHSAWLERYKSSFLSRFPKISKFLAVIDTAREVGLKNLKDSDLLISFIWDNIVAFQIMAIKQINIEKVK